LKVRLKPDTTYNVRLKPDTTYNALRDEVRSPPTSGEATRT
jgi:hypothetical protein